MVQSNKHASVDSLLKTCRFWLFSRLTGRTGTLAVLLALGSIVSGFAQSNDSTTSSDNRTEQAKLIRAQLGLAGQFAAARPGHWNTLNVLVDNPDDRDANALITFRSVGQESVGQFNFRKTFSLPGKTQRRIRFPVQLASALKPVPKTITFHITLFANGQMVDELESSARTVNENVKLIAVLHGKSKLFSFLDGQILFPSGGPEFLPRSSIKLVELNTAKLPDSAIELAQLDFLILSRQQVSPLRGLQQQAIRHWIRTGGQLLVVEDGPPDYLSHFPFDQLLPVDVIQQHPVTTLPEAATWSKELITTDRPFLISETILQKGTALFHHGDLPLIVTSPYGLGNVTYVGIEPNSELATNSAHRTFWLTLLEQLQQPAVLDIARVQPQLETFLENFVGKQVTGIWLPLVLVVSYLSLVVYFTRTTNRFRKPHQLWYRLGGASVLFTILTLLFGSFFGPETSGALYEFWIAKGKSGSNLISFHEYLSVLPERRDDLEVITHSSNARLAPLGNTGTSVFNVHHDPHQTRLNVHSEKGQYRTLQLQGHASLQGLHARGHLHRKGLVMELSNQSKHPLIHTFLKLGRRVLPTGNFAPQESRNLPIIGPTTQTGLSQAYEKEGLLDDNGLFRRLVLEELIISPRNLTSDQPLALVPRGTRQGTYSQSFWGIWTSRAPVPVTWQQSSDRNQDEKSNRSLGFVALVPEFVLAESEFLIPKGLMTLNLPQPGAASYYFGQHVLRGDRPVLGSILTLEFRLPRWARPAQIQQAHLFVDFDSDAFQLRVFHGEQELDIPPGQKGQLEIPFNDSFIDKEVISLRLQIEPTAEFADDETVLASDSDTAPAEKWRGHSWSIREIEVESVCRSRSPLAMKN